MFARVLAVLLGVFVSPFAAAEMSRSYDDGPLAPADFKQRVPANSPHHARTITRLTYSFRYRSLTRNGSTIVALSSVTPSGVMDGAQ